METTVIKGVFFALISTASWALCSIVLKKLGERLDPIGMTFVKSFLSAIFLFLTAIFFNLNVLIPLEYFVPIILSGIIGISFGDSLFFASLNRLSPMVLSLILFVGPDIFTGIFGILFLGEMPSFLCWCGIFLVLFGLAFFIFPLSTQDASDTKTTMMGIIFALLALICTAYSMVLIKPVLSNVHIVAAVMYRMLFSSIFLLIYGLFSKKFFAWKNNLSDFKYNIKLFLTIALVTFGGFLFSLLAVKYCDLVVASTIMGLEPLFIMILMASFFKKFPKRNDYIGLIFCLLGILLIIRG